MPHGVKGEGSAVSTAKDVEATPKLGKAHTRASTPDGLVSWRPSAGLSPVECYGRFEILGRIGRGGMAEILLARERSPAGSTRHLVIKRILPEAADSDEMLHMFLDEARVVMGLSHPHLCQIYEIGEQDGTWFIAMEWVNGATLHQLIRRAFSDNDVDYGVIARIIAHAAEALHHAHTARDAEGRLLHLVHRDVSPHNIMLGYDGRVKLLDFGIAKSIKSTHRTEAGVVKGKVCYMAPEQWLSSPVDARTDVFALGACLYEALTGRIVFRRDTQSEVMRAVLKEGAPALSQVAPQVPSALAIITHKALAFSPGDRFQSALEMSEALEQYLAARSTVLAASKIACYVRRLFRSEVELGPILERQVRGAHLPEAPVVLPRLPPALLGLPKLTPSLLGAGLQEPGPAPIQGAKASSPLLLPPVPRTRSMAATVVDAVSRAPAPEVDPLDVLDGTQSTERPLSSAPVQAQATEAESSPLAEIARGPEPAAPEGTPEARPLARTVSMRAASSARRVAMLVIPSAVAMASVMYASLPSAPAGLSGTRARPIAVSLPAAASYPQKAHSAPAAVLPQVELAPATQAISAGPEKSASPASDERAERNAKHGKLSINTRPWSTVYLGNRMLGTTPLANVSVPRGPLTLKLVDRDGKVHLRRLARARSTDRSAFYDFEASGRRVRRR